MNKAYKDNFISISNHITAEIEEGFSTLVNLVKANGGFLRTPASSDKPTLYAYYEDFDELRYHKAIHGFHYDEELGLCICTDEMLENYQFDTGYYFEYFWDFQGEDLENLNKALDDAAYYVEIDKYDLLITDTMLSIIHGISAYL